MASSRRRSLRWPWALLALIGLALAGVYLVWSGDTESAIAGLSDDTASPGGAEPAALAEAASPVPAQPASALPPVRQIGARPVPADVPTLTLDAPRSSAARPEPAPARPRAVEPTRPTPPAAVTGAQAPRSAVARGMALVADGRLVDGRAVLSQALFDPQNPLPAADAQTIRDTLTSVNEKLVFSSEIVPGDPLVEAYTVQSGDRLVRIAPQYKVPYPFIERINRTEAPRLRAGQTIKLVRGPFHARIIKHDYRLDLYLRGPDGLPIYVRSYPVGLGEGDSTPLGNWRIEPGRKVTNPDWRNPRTGEYFAANDRGNPIGEYWLALEGLDDETSGLEGYGIHGTIDPGSIGSQASMGCIRLRDQDIREVYGMLVEEHSTVQVLP